MLEYLDYSQSARWWPEDAYAAEVLRHHGCLQSHGHSHIFYSQPLEQDKSYYFTGNVLLATGTLLRDSVPVDDVLLRTFTPLTPRLGMGISCQGMLLLLVNGSPNYIISRPEKVLAVAVHISFMAYLLSNGECWIASFAGEDYHIHLPFKPLAICGGVNCSLYFLRPDKQVQQWLRQDDGSYSPGRVEPATGTVVNEYFIQNA